MNAPNNLAILLVTCSSALEGETIATALLKDRVAACVNIIPGVNSLYLWEGKIERATELLLVIKTRPALVEELRRKVVELHSYEIPEVVMLEADAVHDPYFAWLLKETERGTSPEVK